MSSFSTPAAGDPLAGLNPAQAEAVLHHEGPMLVLAGAGSGKTRVLTTRIARLIREHGVPPREILAVTFTNKAAGEMRERIARLLGEAPVGMWAGTFHAIGARMLRMSPHLVGRTASFTIYDEDDALLTVKRVMEKQKISPKEWTPKSLLAAISDAKNALVPPSEYEALAQDPLSRHAAAIYRELEPTLRQLNAVTFDDLLVLPVRMLEENPHLLDEYRRRFRHILVDEYQDTNRAQYRLVTLLGGGHGNVSVVGDDDQSIYGWRGADIRNILDFEKDFPKARVVRLEENYRSSPQILDLANAVIAANTERRGKTLRATRPGVEKPLVVRCLDERDESEYVIEMIREHRGRRSSRVLRDFAVLYRTNSQSRAIEEGLRRHAIPYRLIGSVRFYDRKEIRDLMSYLKLVANPADNEAFRRAIQVPKRGLGDTTVEMLAGAAGSAGVPMLVAAGRPDLVGGLPPAKRKALADFAETIGKLRAKAPEASVDELLLDLIEAIHYREHLKAEGDNVEERLDNIRELVTGAAETVEEEGGEVGLTPLDHFLQRATLVAQIDQLDPNADAVTLMTLHNAKGLEFPVVFITGLEDGLFPLARAYDEPHLLEEERRLFYVGITRAEEHLHVTWAETRRRNGETLPSRPSSFLQAIPKELVTERPTMRARSSGRMSFSDTGSYGGAGGYGRSGWGDDAPALGGGGGARRGGATPRWSAGNVGSLAGTSRGAPSKPADNRSLADRSRASVRSAAPEDESQDQALIVVGARVAHRKFGTGTIAELAGAGRDLKAKIDFDDETIGRKTLVVAQANLERAVE